MELPVDRLIAYGFSEALLSALKASGVSTLRGPQARAVSSGDLFSSEHLLVHLPTSAGKTLLGELCALSAILAGKKALFAVPLKALAEEKYAEWQRRYADYGLAVVCSTADHNQDDARLCRGQFDLGIVIYEKLRYLLSRAPRLFRQVGVVVWDEMQMLFDPNRGPLVELLLAHLRMNHPGVRQVGLSAVLDRPEELALYLSARLVQSEARPAPLRKGILYQGRFAYTTEPDGESGEERWKELEGVDGPPHELALRAALHLAGRGEPTLLFVSSRGEAQGLALQAAGMLPPRPATIGLAQLARMGDNQVGAHLAETLRHGAAFHNADLTPDQRRLVEQGFRSGEIILLAATSTLSMGVNLPVQNVVILPFSWSGATETSPERRLLLPQEWSNRAGRAGRDSRRFGRAILPATSPKERDIYHRQFFEGLGQRLPLNLSQQEVVRSGPVFVLWGYATDQQLREFLAATPSGCARLRPSVDAPDWERAAGEALARATAAGLVRKRSGGRHACTRLGRVVAELGLGVAEAEAIVQFWQRVEGEPGEGLLLFFAGLLEPARQAVFPLEGSANRRQGYVEELRDWLSDSLEQVEEGLCERARWEEAHEAAAKKALALRAWMEGEPGAALEERFHAPEGRFHELADTLAWLLEGCLSVGRTLGRELEGLEGLPARARLGIPPELLPLLPYRVPGMGRAELLQLRREGFTTPEDLAAAPEETLAAVLTPETGAALYRAVAGLRRSVIAANQDLPAADTLDVQGRPVGRRAAVLLNGRTVLLAPRSLGILARLAWGRRRDHGWVPRDRLGVPPEYVGQYVSRLRRELSPYQIEPGTSLVEGDGTGRLRLRVAAENLRLDPEQLAVYWPGLHLPVHKSCPQLVDC